MATEEPRYVQAYSINPNKVVLYDRYIGPRSAGNRTKGYDNLKNNENLFGELSQNAERRMLKALDYMIYLSREKTNYGHYRQPISKTTTATINSKSKQALAENGLILEKEKGTIYKKPINYKLTFITLTLSSTQVHSDNEIKAQLLNQFLIELRRDHGVQMYIWKAEKQQNQNIHFHILTDKYIPWRPLRALWNRIQNKLGYIDRYGDAMREFYKNGFRPTQHAQDHRSIKHQLEAWKRGKETSWTDPNSTDIHGIIHVKNIRNYMAKYLTKTTDKEDKDRKSKMEYIQVQINDLKSSIEGDRLVPYSDKNAEFQKKSIILELQRQFDELRKMGVEGRIWGSSQLLSKMKGLGDFGDPPDIDLLAEKAEKIWRNEIGPDVWVTTYFVNFNDTPDLKNYFDSYINSLFPERLNL